MWECSKCHNQNEEMAGYCYHCKTATRPDDGVGAVQGVQMENDVLLVLSFFIPIVGVILYLAFRGKSKKVAEAYLTWAIVAVCMVAYIVFVVCTGMVFGVREAVLIAVELGLIIGCVISLIGGNKKALYVLSFFFPIVGLISFIVKRESDRIAAKKCLKWALISIGIFACISVLLVAGWAISIYMLGA